MFSNINFILIILLGLILGSLIDIIIFWLKDKQGFSFKRLFSKEELRKKNRIITVILVSTANALFYGLTYLRFGLSLKGVLLMTLTSTLIVVTAIDFILQEIPNGLNLFILVFSLLSFFVNDIPFWERLIGFVAASLILLILALLTNGFGGGDIKLMAVCGILLGYKLILLALFLGIVIGGIVGAVVLAVKKSKNEEGASMAFGPYLSVAILISALYGDSLIKLYLGLIGF